MFSLLSVTLFASLSLIEGTTFSSLVSPQIQSEDYNDERLSIDFDALCLETEDPTDEITQILDLFPCLQKYKNGRDIPTYFYNKKDKISRVYLDISNNGECLGDHEINWDNYCIMDISYESMVTIDEVVSNEKTNAIYYNGTLKSTPWQLDFLDGNETDNNYKYYNGINNTNDDHEIDIWILDTGVYAEHYEFLKGQVIDEYANFSQGHPHGTGVAACASGINYGVGKNFKIHDYPVCQYGGSCGSADIFAGLYKVLSYLQNGKGKRSVINMSLGTGVSDVSFFENMFDDIVNAGGIVVVASGNWGDDACQHNYAYYSNLVISVGSHDISKVRASSSSYGNCVHIYAPGVGVSTAYSYTDPTVVQAKSGTSFASPITAGRVANMLHENPTLSRNEIVSILQTTNTYPVTSCTSGYCYGSYYIAPTTVGNYIKYDFNHQLSLSTTTSKNGVSGTIYVDTSATINGFSCRIDVTHNNRSNLDIYLTSPQGTQVNLVTTNSYDNEANIHNTYFESKFDGQDMAGTWTLTVYDRVAKYAGRVDNWNLKFYTKSATKKIESSTPLSGKSCSCTGGSRKCTGYLENECASYSGCYWACA